YIGKSEARKRMHIFGAGAAGEMIARQLNHWHNDSELWQVAFVDDDVTKQRMQVYDLPVVGTVKDIPQVVEQKDIAHIVIAIPSLKNGQLKESSIIAMKQKRKCK